MLPYSRGGFVLVESYFNFYVTTVRRLISSAAFHVVISVLILMPSSSAQTGATTDEFELARAARQEVTYVAALPEVHLAFAWFRSQQRNFNEQQMEITRIAAPPFGEGIRANWLRDKFVELGLTDVHIDDIGNVLGLWPGTDPKANVLVISAHIDTVFPPGTPMKVRRDGERLLGPGISDNAAGVVGLLAIAGAIHESGIRTRMPILFVGNVGEEGEGDIRGMRHLFSESKWANSIDYTLVLDGAGSNSIVTQALGSKRFLITVHGPGGHSWSDFGMPNPIVALARAIDEFSGTEVPLDPKTTFNIGVIEGGTSVNSIPESASVKVDLRSASSEEIVKLERALKQAIERAVLETSVMKGRRRESDGQLLTYEMKLIGNRPAAELKPNSRLLAIVQATDQLLGNTAHLQRASTDANIPLSQGREAIAMGAGGTGGGAHTLHEWYDPSSRELGLKRILLTALSVAGVESQSPKR